MNVNILCPLCVCICMVLGGCTASNPSLEGAESGDQSLAGYAPAAPEGTRLGAPYLSALNEQCFEVYPVGGAPVQAQALCARDGGWALLPSIYLGVAALAEPVMQTGDVSGNSVVERSAGQ